MRVMCQFLLVFPLTVKEGLLKSFLVPAHMISEATLSLELEEVLQMTLVICFFQLVRPKTGRADRCSCHLGTAIHLPQEMCRCPPGRLRTARAGP